MINCEVCNTPIDERVINNKALVPCLSCSTPIRTDMFPAAFRNDEASAGPQPVVLADDAGCYYHPSKKAVIPCTSCGRFLCALCDIEMDGEHICFACMESMHKKKTVNTLEKSRFLHDSLALRLSIFPLVMFWLTCVTAPIALYITLRYWKTEGSIAPRRKRWRFVVSLILSSVQIGCWIVGIYFLIKM